MYHTTAVLVPYATMPSYLPSLVVYWRTMQVLGNAESVAASDERKMEEGCEWPSPEIRNLPLCPFRRR